MALARNKIDLHCTVLGEDGKIVQIRIMNNASLFGNENSQIHNISINKNDQEYKNKVATPKENYMSD